LLHLLRIFTANARVVRIFTACERKLCLQRMCICLLHMLRMSKANVRVFIGGGAARPDAGARWQRECSDRQRQGQGQWQGQGGWQE